MHVKSVAILSKIGSVLNIIIEIVKLKPNWTVYIGIYFVVLLWKFNPVAKTEKVDFAHFI